MTKILNDSIFSLSESKYRIAPKEVESCVQFYEHNSTFKHITGNMQTLEHRN